MICIGVIVRPCQKGSGCSVSGIWGEVPLVEVVAQGSLAPSGQVEARRSLKRACGDVFKTGREALLCDKW